MKPAIERGEDVRRERHETEDKDARDERENVADMGEGGMDSMASSAAIRCSVIRGWALVMSDISRIAMRFRATYM